MPTVTCPYCKMLNDSKFKHKQHVRLQHPEYFEKNIRTSITGAESELSTTQSPALENMVVHTINRVICDNSGVTMQVDTTNGSFGIHFGTNNVCLVPGTKTLLFDCTSPTIELINKVVPRVRFNAPEEELD